METIEQALFSPSVSGAGRLLRSPGFLDEWVPEVELLPEAFGTPPEGVACPEALFVRPLSRDRVAVVRVTDGTATGEVRGPLRFHLLAIDRVLYERYNDPFEFAEAVPAPWSAARDLPAVEWPSPPPRPRAVEDLRRVLREGEGPLLLGAAQLLVDGGKLALQRAAPDPKVVRDLWALLPYSTRCEVRPATFAFSDRLGCDLMILPEVPQQEIGGYMTEEQALDYPDSRYERNLQIAVEAGDERGLQRLLSRRSSAQTLRLAIYLLIGISALSALVSILGPPPR